MNRALGHALGLSSAEATNLARSAWERVDRAGLLLNPCGPAGGASAQGPGGLVPPGCRVGVGHPASPTWLRGAGQRREREDRSRGSASPRRQELTRTQTPE